MWARTRLLSKASWYEIINISHFKSDFAHFCTVSHRLCANMHKVSLGAPFNLLKTWSVHQHYCSMLQAIAALKFAQGATINDKRFCSSCGILATTCLPFNSNTDCSSILHSYRILQLFISRKLLLSSTLPILLRW